MTMSSMEPAVELALEVKGTFLGSLLLSLLLDVVDVAAEDERGSVEEEELFLMAFLKSSVAHIESSKCSAQCFETLDPA